MPLTPSFSPLLALPPPAPVPNPDALLPGASPSLAGAGAAALAAVALAALTLALGGCSSGARASTVEATAAATRGGDRAAGTAATPPSAGRAVAGEAGAAPAIKVRTAPVGRGEVSRPLRAGGLLRHKNEVDLSFKVGGVISAILVEEGARVRKGQLLARLDTTEVAAAVEQARQGAERAERDLARARRLHDSGAVPVAEAENAETGARVARAVLAAQQFNARHAVIVAPDDGVIDRRLASVGEVAGPGRPVLHLSGESRGAVVRLGLADRELAGLAVGTPARVTLDARPDDELAARVTQIATFATPGSGTFEVEVRLERAPAEARSGMTAKVLIDRRLPTAGHVPLASLVDADGREAAVFTIEPIAKRDGTIGIGDEARARRVPVKVAFLFGDRAALAAGLDGIEQVVTDGASALADGAPVRVLGAGAGQ